MNINIKINNPTTANLLRIVLSAGSLALSYVGGFLMGLADATGLSYRVTNYLGEVIDHHLGYSLGEKAYNAVRNIFKPTNNAELNFAY